MTGDIFTESKDKQVSKAFKRVAGNFFFLVCFCEKKLLIYSSKKK